MANKDYIDKISVLVPMYNAEKTVKKCVLSIMKQTYTNLEIIVVDDGSKDNSFNIVQELAKRDERIRLLHKENEGSLARTREFLLEQVKTKYFVFIDSDDIVKRKYVEHLYNTLIKYDADCVASGFLINGIFPFYSILPCTKIVTGDDIVSASILSRNIHYVVWNKIYKTDLMNKTKIDTDVSFGEDFVRSYEYFRLCKKVVYINKNDYKYLMNKSSMIHKKFSNKNVEFLTWLENAEKLETNEKNKKALRAWIAFTSASFKYFMKKSKVVDRELLNRINENISKYNDDLMKNKFTSKVFKIAYNHTKRIKL